MTGQELIDWIKEHNAEEKKVVVLYGGRCDGYPINEDLEPEKVLFFTDKLKDGLGMEVDGDGEGTSE